MTQEFVLRAMATNYAGGHCWDHLDGEACSKAADEIKGLREALARSSERMDEALRQRDAEHQKNIDWAKGNLQRVREDVQADIRLAEAFRPMTMQDIRLAAGEGKLTPQTVLSAANAVLRMRKPFVPLVSSPVTEKTDG